MAYKSLYTIWPTSDSHNFRVSKFDEDLDAVESYNIAEVGTSMLCTCPAGGRHTCRHRQMLRIFQGLERIGSGLFYQFDTKKWYDQQGKELQNGK